MRTYRITDGLGAELGMSPGAGVVSIQVFYPLKGCEDKALAVLREVVERARSNHPGLVRTLVYKGLDGRTLAIHTEWKSKAQCDAVLRDGEFVRRFDKLRELGLWESHVYETTDDLRGVETTSNDWRVQGSWRRASPSIAGAPMKWTREIDETFAEQWAEAWNGRAVEAVLTHFHDDVVFTSPAAVAVVGSPIVRGKEALRAYWTAALARITSLRFTLDHVVWDPVRRELAIIYTSHIDGISKRVSENLTFNDHGQVVSGEVFHGIPVSASAARKHAIG